MTNFDGITIVIGLLALLSGILMFWTLPVPSFHSNKTSQLPLVSIIIPARNEAGRIIALLQSLKQQRFQSFELLVVDDDSSDKTAAIAADYGATVIYNQSKENSSGKSLACWQGAKQARGKWLLFLDADTYFANTNSLEKLLLSYQNKGATGIMSLQPFHTINRLYENLSAIFNIIVVVGMNVFTVWKQRFEPAGSFGPCILCDREEYFLTGGHKGIQHALMDDLALGEAFLAKNLPVHCLGEKERCLFACTLKGLKV
ncbi:MAG: glycosyltransferase family 2 protein [Pisciglobus halotolerans]|nr:glycosyltransferase family 2 protein [Pisciglobus halotolerans]